MDYGFLYNEVTVQGALESALWPTLKAVHNIKLATRCWYGAIFFPLELPLELPLEFKS